MRLPGNVTLLNRVLSFAQPFNTSFNNFFKLLLLLFFIAHSNLLNCNLVNYFAANIFGLLLQSVSRKQLLIVFMRCGYLHNCLYSTLLFIIFIISAESLSVGSFIHIWIFKSAKVDTHIGSFLLSSQAQLVISKENKWHFRQ